MIKVDVILKWSAVSLTIILFISGLVLTGFAAAGMKQWKGFTIEDKSIFVSLYFAVLIIGILMELSCALAIVGIFAPFSKDYWFLFVAAAAMIFLALGNYGVPIGMMIVKDRVDKDLERALEGTIDLVLSNTTSWKTVDAYQQKLECCGVKGPEDYTQRKEAIPDSCCEKRSCGTPFKQGCLEPFAEFLIGLFKYLICLMFTFGIILLIDAANLILIGLRQVKRMSSE